MSHIGKTFCFFFFLFLMWSERREGENFILASLKIILPSSLKTFFSFYFSIVFSFPREWRRFFTPQGFSFFFFWCSIFINFHEPKTRSAFWIWSWWWFFFFIFFLLLVFLLFKLWKWSRKEKNTVSCTLYDDHKKIYGTSWWRRKSNKKNEKIFKWRERKEKKSRQWFFTL